MRTSVRVPLIALLSVGAWRAHAQTTQAPGPPRVFVESLRRTDSLSRHAAIQLRAALIARTQPTVLRVVPTDVIDRTKQASVNDSASAWEWDRVRDFARQVAAQHIVDVAASHDSNTFRVIAYIVHPVRTGEPTPLPIFNGRSLNEAVATLADYLATRTWPPTK